MNRMPSDIDGPGVITYARHQTESMDMIETTLERMEEAKKMPPILQGAAYSAIRDDLRDCLAENNERISQREIQLTGAMQVLAIIANTLPHIGGNELSVASLMKDIKSVTESASASRSLAVSRLNTPAVSEP